MPEALSPLALYHQAAWEYEQAIQANANAETLAEYRECMSRLEKTKDALVKASIVLSEALTIFILVGLT